MLPVITVGGVNRFDGGLHHFDETVFQWPGTGFLFLEAITRVDTPLITAYVIFVGWCLWSRIPWSICCMA